jgi:hypothetical protein
VSHVADIRKLLNIYTLYPTNRQFPIQKCIFEEDIYEPEFFQDCLVPTEVTSLEMRKLKHTQQLLMDIDNLYSDSSSLLFVYVAYMD